MNNKKQSCNKPEITKVCLLSTGRKHRHKEVRVNNVGEDQILSEVTVKDIEYENYHFKLTNVDVENDELAGRITIENVPEKIVKEICKYKRYAQIDVGFTDDPRVIGAGDWADLGCFTLTIRTQDCKPMPKGKGLMIVTKPNTEKKPWNLVDMTTPDKVAWRNA